MTIGKDGAMLTLVTPKWRAVFQAPAGAFRRAVACEFTRVIDGVEALRKGLWWLIEHAKPKHIREHAVAMARDAGELCGDANGLAFNSSVEIYQPLHEIKLVSMISRKELH
jgi:hypothetical protein